LRQVDVTTALRQVDVTTALRQVDVTTALRQVDVTTDLRQEADVNIAWRLGEGVIVFRQVYVNICIA
jgi:hypothetical protein